MATDQDFVQYVCEESGLRDALSYKKMFGEYALYLDGKVVALVCDNQLFVKPTAEGRGLLGAVSEQPPYPGGKPYFQIDIEFDDPELLGRLLRITALALPLPKPKAAKRQPRSATT
ncbi:MAG: TfoX/Sxy family protein [Ardenticatenia bacterium]|nr:TfoX/Sxy family protein [Ardenticatenia bacterium]